MSYSRGQRNLIGIGDVIAVLASLGLSELSERQRACALLGYSLAAPLPAYQRPAPSSPKPRLPPKQELLEPEDAEPAPQVENFATEPPAVDLPPAQRGEFEDLPLPHGGRPTRDPFASPPGLPAIPAKAHLLTPRYERAILRDLCVADRACAQLNAEAIAAMMAARRPLIRLPRLTRRRVVPRVVLWLDVSQSMQLFDEDLRRLATTLRRLLAGSSEVSVSRWVGVPQPGPTAFATAPVIGSGSSARQVVLLASDLGGGGQKAARIRLRTNVQYVQAWSRNLLRAETMLSLLVPLPYGRWNSVLGEAVKGAEWSRLSRPGYGSRRGKRRVGTLRLGSLATDTVSAHELRRLARACSLSTRVTPALLRQLRLDLLPHLGPDAEAEIWSAPFMREATVSAAVLMPAEADALRAELPHYAELVAWLEEAGYLTEAEIALLRPATSIDDGFDDLWVDRVSDKKRVAPRLWGSAQPALGAVLRRADCLSKVADAFPHWRHELESLGQGSTAVFAEQVRQIGLTYTVACPHLQVEDALTWHALKAAHGDAASLARIDALVAAIHITLLDPPEAAASKQIRDWLRRRHADFSAAVRQRPDVQRIIRIALRGSSGSVMTSAVYEPVDVYAALRGAEFVLSLAPLADAFRIRAVAGEGVSLRLLRGSVDRAITLRSSARVRIDRATGDDLRVQTLVGDTFVIPIREPAAAKLATQARFWLEQAGKELERRDWIAVMRWADRAVACDDIEPAELVQATTLFVDAARCADRRVPEAFERLAAVEGKLLPGADCLDTDGVTVDAMLRLGIARVELCLQDSRVMEAIQTARQYLGAARARSLDTGLIALAARLASRLMLALLRRGDSAGARETLLGMEELTRSESEHRPGAQAWYAVSLGEYAGHTSIRKDAKRALRALAECNAGDDLILIAELQLGRLEIKACFAPGGPTSLDVRDCIAAARRTGDRPLLRAALRRMARHTLHLGNVQEADRARRELEYEIGKARAPRCKAHILLELGYQARHRSLNPAEYLEQARALVPAEELRLMHWVLDEFLRAQVQAEQITWEHPSVRELLEWWARSGELGELANRAGHIVFETHADWLTELLHRQAGGSSPAEALRRICRTLGATQYTVNILTSLAVAEDDPARAQRDLRFAMRTAETLHAAAYVLDVGNRAAVRLIKWEKWRQPGEHRDSNETALRWINRGLAANSPTPGRIGLTLNQAAVYYLLSLNSEARSAASRALQMAQQFDLPAAAVAAYIHDGCFAFRSGEILEAARALQVARRLWSETLMADAGARAPGDGHPYDFGYVGMLILDACEWFKGREPRELSPAEGSFIDDIVWFANDFYVPRLPETSKKTNWIHDLWYAVSQVADLPTPNVIAAYDALGDAQQHQDPNSVLLPRFRNASQKLKLLRESSGPAADA